MDDATPSSEAQDARVRELRDEHGMTLNQIARRHKHLASAVQRVREADASPDPVGDGPLPLALLQLSGL